MQQAAHQRVCSLLFSAMRLPRRSPYPLVPNFLFTPPRCPLQAGAVRRSTGLKQPNFHRAKKEYQKNTQDGLKNDKSRLIIE